ncbi:MAG TPA: MCP four helix bundle domain-containing protein, partial [Rhodocyclaceae bacterium]|nr:MCP four helix bundle domain-containing protein [Rhodocyclaceae bacterium]
MKDMKIGMRLGIGFAVTLALLITIAVVSLMRVGNLNTQIETLVNNQFPKTVQANNIIDSLNNIARHLRNAYIYSGAEQQKSLDAIPDERKIITENLEKLEKSIIDEKGKELLKKVTTARAAYVAAQDKFIELLKAGKRDEIVTLMQGDLRRAQSEYLGSINALIEFQTELVVKTGKEADELAGDTEILLEVLAVIAVLATVGFGWTITRGITGPTQKLVDAADKMAEGDFNFKLEVESQDEVGVLADSVRAIQSNVKRLIEQMNKMSSEHDRGDIDVRIDEASFKNDFARMAQGVNTMVFGHIAVKKKAMACVKEFGEGNMDAPLEKFPGKKAFINETIEQVRANIKALVVDANLLAKAAVEGKLATRADASKHKGDFNRVVAGVNQTLDAVIGPLNVAAKYVDDISKGAIPAKITDSYNGDFNTLKNNLNTCIAAVNALVADANLLSKAAVEGKLATRADASKHQGDFRRVVAGVNDTLDAVIGPLNVAANYVDRISKGDIPPKITDTYNGDFNTLKNNLNTCVDAVNALVADANRLSQAAVAGKLETRADAAKHQGDFRKIVAGVNDTLDNVVGPINEVRRIMEAMANGDMTQTIATHYQGDFDELKNAINTTVTRL